MIGIVDIIRAYSGVLEDALGAPPVTKDIIEVRDRPCVYIQPGGCERTKEGLLIHDSLQLEVYWFAPFGDRGYLALLQARESLSTLLLRPVEVQTGFWVEADKVDADVIRDEMILALTFTVETLQEAEEDETGALMQILELMVESS